MVDVVPEIKVMDVGSGLGVYGRLTDACFNALMDRQLMHRAQSLMSRAVKEGDFRALDQFLRTQGLDEVSFDLDSIGTYVDQHQELPKGALLCRLSEVSSDVT